MNRKGMLVIVKRPGAGPELLERSLPDVFSFTEATSNDGPRCAVALLSAIVNVTTA
jgi:hypothetical protein